MDLLAQIKLGESKILELKEQSCMELGLHEPLVLEKNDFVDVEIYRLSNPDLITDVLTKSLATDCITSNGGLNGGLNEILRSLLQAIVDKSGVQIKDLANILNKSADTIEKQISKLIKLDLIERHGSKKTGGYHLKSLAK